MKKALSAVMFALSVSLCPVGQAKPAAMVTLAHGNVARTAIYITPALAQQKDSELLASVKDLSHYLGLISNSKIPVVSGNPPNSSKLLPILIGDLAVKAFGEPAKKSPYLQGWRLKVSPKGIGMMGQSDQATTYAVYELLDHLGCRWYMPSQMGEYIPRIPTLRVAALDVSGVPATMERTIWYADKDYKRRNRLGGVRVAGAQCLENYLSEAELKEHPDWNAEIGGKRSINGRICWGNPEVAAAIAKKIIDRIDKESLTTALAPDERVGGMNFFRAGKKIVASVSLSPNDGIAFCECSKCRALDTGDYDPTMGCVSITDRLLHFTGQIATQVTQKYPETLFGLYAYVQNTRPPLREKVHPNIVPIIAPITYCRAHSLDDKQCPTRQDLRWISEGWLKASKNVGLYEFNWNLAEQSAPYPMIAKWSDDLRFFYDRGLRFWTPETQSNFESSLPGLYLGIRMSWYNNAAPQSIMTEFYSKFYGPAAAPMRRYWTVIDDAWTKVKEHAGAGFGYEKRFTPAVLESARIAMDAAIAACPLQSVHYQRVQIANERLRQFEYYMAMQTKLNVFYAGLHDLAYDSNVWLQQEKALSRKYKDQYAFTYVNYGPGYPKTSAYFITFYDDTFKDITRIVQNYRLLTTIGFPIREWKYKVDRTKVGDTQKWYATGYDDNAWALTDPSVDTWAALGLNGYFGTVWYNRTVELPDDLSKKTYLWFSRTAGELKLYVNDHLVPYVNPKGEKTDGYTGFSKPVSFDISAAVKPGTNKISARCTRSTLDELGVGGLLGPVAVYAEK